MLRMAAINKKKVMQPVLPDHKLSGFRAFQPQAWKSFH
jgi:hypothetical protein